MDPIKLVISAVLASFIAITSLDMKKPYPPKFIELISEPYVRCACYFAGYFICLYDVLVGLLWFMIIILLHFDYLNLCQKI